VNQTITSVTVVAAGALPNAVGDNGVFVLFWRSADGTIIVPWAKKELLVGDHWQFGAAQTWYERIASSRKPGFRSNTADTSQTIVDASATAPACVWIDGKLYANTSPVTLDLDTAGRNGLDTGSKAANTPYYKYAIPAVSGRTFDVVCSVTAPTTGPTGFTGWSYIGAFATPSASTALQNFRSVGGRFQANREIATASDPGTTGATSWAITNCPVTAKYGLFQLTLTGTGAGETGSLSATNSTEDACAAVLQVNSVATYWWGWCPILTAQTVWLRVSTTTLTFTPEFYGWIEDPMEYK
jgi:hypothetical protein